MPYQYLSFLYWFKQSAVAIFIFSKLESTGESDESALYQVSIPHQHIAVAKCKKEQPYAGSVRYLTKASKEDRGAALKIHLDGYTRMSRSRVFSLKARQVNVMSTGSISLTLTVPRYTAKPKPLMRQPILFCTVSPEMFTTVLYPFIAELVRNCQNTSEEAFDHSAESRGHSVTIATFVAECCCPFFGCLHPDVMCSASMA